MDAVLEKIGEDEIAASDIYVLRVMMM